MLSKERSLNLQLIITNRRKGPYIKKFFELPRIPKSYRLAESILDKKNALEPKYFPTLLCLPNPHRIKDPEARYEAQVLEEHYLRNLNEFVVVFYHIEQSIHKIKTAITIHEPKLQVESYFTDISNIVIALRTDILDKKGVLDLLYQSTEVYLDEISERNFENQYIVSSKKPKSCKAFGIINKTFREGCFWLISLDRCNDNSMQVEFGSMKITVKIIGINEKQGPGVIERLSQDSNPYFTTALLTLDDWTSGLGNGKQKLPVVKNKASLFEYSLSHLRDYELKFVQQKLDERLDKIFSTQKI